MLWRVVHANYLYSVKVLVAYTAIYVSFIKRFWHGQHRIIPKPPYLKDVKPIRCRIVGKESNCKKEV